LKDGASFQKEPGQRHQFSIANGRTDGLNLREIMPRGGARKGSGRKQLGKTRRTIYLNPDIASLAESIATSEKISMGEAIEKIIVDPDFRLLPSPPTECHYSVTLRGSRAKLQILKASRLREIWSAIEAQGGWAASIEAQGGWPSVDSMKGEGLRNVETTVGPRRKKRLR
jgi:hypothetical protein